MNFVKTTVLLATLTGLLVAIGGLIGGPSGLVLFLILAGVMNFVAYWFSDKMALAMAGAKEITESEDPHLFSIVREVATLSKMPMPRVYVVNTDSPNAFATGRNPQHAVVAVTTGIRRILTDRELRGVLGHEMGHVRNRDILTSSVAAAIAMGITFAARMAMWGALLGGGRGNDRDGGGIGDLLMIVLAPIAATVIQLAVSRSREYEADASAARMIGTGEPLARALEKLEAGAERVPVKVNPAEASAYIVNPLRGRNASNLFMTHPPVPERIARLRSGAWAA